MSLPPYVDDIRDWKVLVLGEFRCLRCSRLSMLLLVLVILFAVSLVLLSLRGGVDTPLSCSLVFLDVTTLLTVDVLFGFAVDVVDEDDELLQIRTRPGPPYPRFCMNNMKFNFRSFTRLSTIGTYSPPGQAYKGVPCMKGCWYACFEVHLSNGFKRKSPRKKSRKDSLSFISVCFCSKIVFESDGETSTGGDKAWLE